LTDQSQHWTQFIIEEACDSIVDCVNRTAPTVEGPTPFKMIRTTNVRSGKLLLDSVRYVDADTYERWTRRQVPLVDDVILTREAPLGEVGILTTNDRVFLGQRLVSYRANKKVLDPKFLLYSFQSKQLQAQIQRLGSGATVHHMRVPDSKKLKIALPPLSVQRDIVDKLQEAQNAGDRLQSIYRQKLAAIDELKQSILQKAFAGGLTAAEAVAA
jgi:type I restriction enzyme S subunit